MQSESKMQKVQSVLGALIILALTVMFFVQANRGAQVVMVEKEVGVPAFGAASLDGGYNYKNITASNASGSRGVDVRGGAGVLGYITIASTSPVVALGVRIYDAVATSTTDTTATSTGTLIGKIYTAAAEQTFVFDIAVTKGIVLDVPPGFNGSYIVSYK